MRKILTSVIISSLLLTSASPAFAAAMAASKEPEQEVIDLSAAEPTPEEMEQMIKKVRPLIDVPEEYTDFSWDYFNKYGNASEIVWNFYWSGNKTGQIYVSCDNQGRIIAYESYSYNSPRFASLPEKDAEEYLDTAKAFMDKTAPYLSSLDLRLESVQPPNVFYSHCYTYSFLRYENDIPVPGNVVTLQINHITGEVISFSSSINIDVEFTKPEKLISEDEAKEILSEHQSMKLSYRLKTEYDDEGNLLSRKAYLIYTPEIGYLSVDAQSGKVYTERNSWTAFDAPTFGAVGNNSAMKDMVTEESADAEDGGYRLTEQELEQLEILEKLISKDEAVKKVLENKDLYIIENAYVADARLSKTYGTPRPLTTIGSDEPESKYVWNLYFSSPNESYSGMNAVIDAQDGSLISFSADMPYSYYYEENNITPPEKKFTAEQAIEIASSFIKKQQPEKFENVVYSNSYDYVPIKYINNTDGSISPVYRASRLNFVRQNEGVDFTYNSFSTGVDLVTGKITNYSYTWYDDVEFESPKDAISAQDALMALYSYDGFGINYEVNSDYIYVDGKYNAVKGEIYSRAVYSDYNLGTTTIRALDGKMIDYSGEEYVGKTSVGPYDDIENHWSRDTVSRFIRLGIGPDGTSFKPNEAIETEEFLQLMNLLRLYETDDLLDENETLSRMDAVKFIIASLGYTKIAKLENVFITDFADNSDFLTDDIGFAAIARGFGLIEGDGENFRPYDTLTRAEAYTIAENAVELGILNN